MSLAELLERLGPLLDASSAGHWLPVLTEWISNADGWYAAHAPLEADPAYAELAGTVEFYDSITHVPGQSGKFAPADDISLAAALSDTDFARRSAYITGNPGGPVVRWSLFDGPFHAFMDQAEHHGLGNDVRTGYDVRRPASRLRDELLGRMLVARSRVA